MSGSGSGRLFTHGGFDSRGCPKICGPWYVQKNCIRTNGGVCPKTIPVDRARFYELYPRPINGLKCSPVDGNSGLTKGFPLRTKRRDRPKIYPGRGSRHTQKNKSCQSPVYRSPGLSKTFPELDRGSFPLSVCGGPGPGVSLPPHQRSGCKDPFPAEPPSLPP